MDLEQYGLTEEFPEVFSASSLLDYISCPSKFYLSRVLGRKTKAPPHPSLQWGSMWHKVMELFHDDQDPKAALEYIYANWPPELTQLDDKLRTMERMATLFVKYVKKYGKGDMRRWRTVRREQMFEIHCPENDPSCPFGGCGIAWRGVLDRVAEEISSGDIYNWDYKTTAWLRKTTWDEFKRGVQFKGYNWATRHLSRGRVVGTFVDLLHVTKTIEDMHRTELRYLDVHIEEWVRNVRTWIDRAQEDWSRFQGDPEGWPKNWAWCDQYGGCVYKDIHDTPNVVTSRGSTRLHILKEDFVEDRWSPFNVT